MTTIPLTCPSCGEYLRVAVQPSQIDVDEGNLYVAFDSQTVAHICKKEVKK